MSISITVRPLSAKVCTRYDAGPIVDLGKSVTSQSMRNESKLLKLLLTAMAVTHCKNKGANTTMLNFMVGVTSRSLDSVALGDRSPSTVEALQMAAHHIYLSPLDGSSLTGRKISFGWQAEAWLWI